MRSIFKPLSTDYKEKNPAVNFWRLSFEKFKGREVGGFFILKCRGVCGKIKGTA
jgi:hypothetical protein